CLQDYTTPSAF
nr:immunoglobulin light chain junction region [Macaca mulatta]